MQQLSACGYVCFFVLYDCRLCARFHALVSFSAAKTQDQMQSRFFLNVVVGQRATVFQLLAGKNQTLLIGRNALFVLNLLLDLLNVVARLDVERNRLSCECFDKDLHFCQSWLVVVSVDRLGTFFSSQFSLSHYFSLFVDAKSNVAFHCAFDKLSKRARHRLYG